MKIKHFARLLGWVCAGALASCAAPPVQPVRMKVSGSVSSQASASCATSARVFQKVNEYRMSRGKASLQRHSGLDQLAQDHSEYLRKHRGSFGLHGSNVSHIGFDGRVAVARYRYEMETISENVASASNSGGVDSQTLVNLWINSKDHHKNMLDKWTCTGVGLARDADGTVFATQLFGVTGNSQLARRDRFSRH